MGTKIDGAQSMMCAIGRILEGLKVVLCFMHGTPYHYHHYADVLTLTHMLEDSAGVRKCLLGLLCRECV